MKKFFCFTLFIVSTLALAGDNDCVEGCKEMGKECDNQCMTAVKKKNPAAAPQCKNLCKEFTASCEKECADEAATKR